MCVCVCVCVCALLIKACLFVISHIHTEHTPNLPRSVLEELSHWTLYKALVNKCVPYWNLRSLLDCKHCPDKALCLLAQDQEGGGQKR